MPSMTAPSPGQESIHPASARPVGSFRSRRWKPSARPHSGDGRSGLMPGVPPGGPGAGSRPEDDSVVGSLDRPGEPIGEGAERISKFGVTAGSAGVRKESDGRPIVGAPEGDAGCCVDVPCPSTTATARHAGATEPSAISNKQRDSRFMVTVLRGRPETFCEPEDKFYRQD